MHIAVLDGKLYLVEINVLSRFAGIPVEMGFAPGQTCARVQMARLLHPAAQNQVCVRDLDRSSLLQASRGIC
ncbi:hypothetical protein Chor_001330 [Crotalus horridus]